MELNISHLSSTFFRHEINSSKRKRIYPSKSPFQLNNNTNRGQDRSLCDEVKTRLTGYHYIAGVGE